MFFFAAIARFPDATFFVRCFVGIFHAHRPVVRLDLFADTILVVIAASSTCGNMFLYSGCSFPAHSFVSFHTGAAERKAGATVSYPAHAAPGAVIDTSTDARPFYPNTSTLVSFLPHTYWLLCSAAGRG